jgi:hypothetical protein
LVDFLDPYRRPHSASLMKTIALTSTNVPGILLASCGAILESITATEEPIPWSIARGLKIVNFGVLVGTCSFAVDWLRRSKCKPVIRYCKHSPFFCLLYLNILSNCGYCIGDRSNYNFLFKGSDEPASSPEYRGKIDTRIAVPRISNTCMVDKNTNVCRDYIQQTRPNHNSLPSPRSFALFAVFL